MNPREMVLSLVTAAVVLFGLYFWLRGMGRIEFLNDISSQRALVQEQMKRDRDLAQSRPREEARLADLSALLPEFPADEKMQVYWLAQMDSRATRHGVAIRVRQAGEEIPRGRVYELPIECREWEADLEPLMRFLYDLQSSGAMMDVRQLSIRGRAGAPMKGGFTLYCAYTRAGGPAGSAAPRARDGAKERMR
jgi:hypothetical protein